MEKIIEQENKPVSRARNTKWLGIREEAQPNYEISKLALIFKIKSVAGLWIQYSKPNKSGMVGLKNLESGVTISFPYHSLISLSSYRFITEQGHKNLNIAQVFDNIEKGAIDLDTVVPNRDVNEFKEHHLRDVLKIYQTFTKALKNGN